jgi:hypothetical protein
VATEKQTIEPENEFSTPSTEEVGAAFRRSGLLRNM